MRKEKIRLVERMYWVNGSRSVRYRIEILRACYVPDFPGEWRTFREFTTLFFALRAFKQLQKNKEETRTVIAEAEVFL